MSYILDALRKADAERERERGGVPSLHSQPIVPISSEPSAASAMQPWLWGVIAGLTVLVVGLVGWIGLGRQSASSEPLPGLQGSQSGASATVGLSVATTPPVATAQRPAQRPGSDQVLARQPLAAAPLMPVVPAAPPLPSRARAAQEPAQMGDRARPWRPDPSATAAERPNSALAATDKIYSVDELPEEIRSQVPALNINGSKYSDRPSSRILIIDGQIFHEGDQLGHEVTLEQIRLKEAILRLRHYRYRIHF